MPGLGGPPEAPHRTGRKDARCRAAWQRAGSLERAGILAGKSAHRASVLLSRHRGDIAWRWCMSGPDDCCAEIRHCACAIFHRLRRGGCRLCAARTRLESDSPNDLFCDVEPSRGSRAVARHLRSGDVGGNPFWLRACGQRRLPYSRGAAKPAIEELAGLTTCRFRIVDWSSAPSHAYGG